MKKKEPREDWIHVSDGEDEERTGAEDGESSRSSNRWVGRNMRRVQGKKKRHKHERTKKPKEDRQKILIVHKPQYSLAVKYLQSHLECLLAAEAGPCSHCCKQQTALVCSHIYLNLPVKEASFSTVKMLFQLLSVLFTLNTTVKSSKKQQRVCEARHSKVNACQNSGSPAWITSRYGCS